MAASVDTFSRRSHIFDPDSEFWSNPFVQRNLKGWRAVVPRMRDQLARRNCGTVIGKIGNMWGAQHVCFFCLVRDEPYFLFQQDGDIFRINLQKEISYGGQFNEVAASNYARFMDPECKQFSFQFSSLPRHMLDVRGDILDLVLRQYQGTTICTQMHPDSNPNTQGWALVLFLVDAHPFTVQNLRVLMNLETGELVMKEVSFSTPRWESTQLMDFDHNLLTAYLTPSPQRPVEHRPVKEPQPEEPILSSAVRGVNVDWVIHHFSRTASPHRRVSRVQLLKDDVGIRDNFELLVRLTSDTFRQLDDRRNGEYAGVFSMPIPQDLPADDLQDKRRLLDWFKDTVKTPEWTDLPKSYANVLPVWHGASWQAIDGISVHGFASLVNADAADPGWFVNGRYTTAEAEYACMFASDYPTPQPPNATGEWVVLLCAAVVGLAYPITPGRADFPTGPLPPIEASQCKYYGGGFNRPADVHVVAIDHKCMCTTPDTARFHEVVFDRDSAILPLAKVFFR